MRQLIPALLLLTLLLPAAAAAQSPVTRVQFVAALWTCSGAVPYDANGPFSDVNPNSPGATAVAWAYDLGIVRGTGGTLFVPDRPITREEAAVLLRRYAVHLGRDTFLPSGVAACNDFEGISPWADDSLYWAAGIGLLAWGADGRPEPQGTLSPEELEQALARFLTALSRLFPIFWSTGELPFKQKMPGTIWFQAFLCDRQASPAPSSPAPPRWAPASQCLPRWQSAPP